MATGILLILCNEIVTIQQSFLCIYTRRILFRQFLRNIALMPFREEHKIRPTFLNQGACATATDCLRGQVELDSAG